MTPTSCLKEMVDDIGIICMFALVSCTASCIPSSRSCKTILLTPNALNLSTLDDHDCDCGLIIDQELQVYHKM